MSGKITIQGGWDDVPHLEEAAKIEMLAAILPYQRDARSKGIPDLGAGAVYPMTQEDYITDRKPDPSWKRAYGLDVGRTETAAVWIAFDPEQSFAIAYEEYWRGDAEPSIHAAAIRAKGEWIPGAVDPASIAGSQIDGRQLIELYRDLGLDLTPADNAVTAGTGKVWNLFSTGQLKIARHLTHLLRQLKIYRHDEKHRIVKVNDHGPDALRYCVMTGPDIMRARPASLSLDSWLRPTITGSGWMG